MKKILITGAPGIGKTTVIKNIGNKIKKRGLKVQGFYTEEVRYNGQRSGFKVVDFDGIYATLADLSKVPTSNTVKNVGRYTVYLDKFETVALPSIENLKTNSILLIDEIGKMELLSEKFQENIKNIFEQSQTTIIATVPIKGPLFVENLKKDKACLVFEVTRDNREKMPDELLHLL